MSKQIYIAGPMCGKAWYNFPAFFDAEERWKKAGWNVVNPAKCDEESDFKPRQHDEFADPGYCTIDHTPHDNKYYLWRDLPYLAACHAIALLPGWERSEGAQIELAVAQGCGLLVFDAETMRGFMPPKMLIDPAQYAMPETTEARRDDPEHPRKFPVAKEVRMTDPTTGAQKGQKLARFDLIPSGPLWELAEHYGRGSKKYADRNWEKGYDWSLSYAAAMRHLTQFWGGEDIDPETGTLHVIAAAWHCFSLAEYRKTHPEKDDRPDCRPREAKETEA